MLRLVTNTIKQIVFIPLFIFSSAAISQTLSFSDAIQLIDSQGNVDITPDYTSIGNGAFANTTVRTVHIPDSITHIGMSAFANTPYLESVTFPNGITRIEPRTFQNSNISNIVLPSSVSSIGEAAFLNSKVSSINLDYVISIGVAAFAGSEILHVVLADYTIVDDFAFMYTPIKSLKVGYGVIMRDAVFLNSESDIKTLESNSDFDCTYKAMGIGFENYGFGVGSYQCDGFGFTNALPALEFLILRGVAVETYYYTQQRYQNYLSAPQATVIIEGGVETYFDLDSKAAIYLSPIVAPIGLSASVVISYCEDHDSDLDGHQDCYDQFPNDPDRWFEYSESVETITTTLVHSDNDGLADIFDSEPTTNNAHVTSSDSTNPEHAIDSDGDGIRNEMDIDDDDDGLLDIYEPFYGTNPLIPDSDFDGTLDSLDAFPLDNTESLDTDSDGIGDNTDTDDDNDGYTDFLDAFPTDSTEWADSDLDGIGNNADLDDDNDGVADTEDAFPHTASESLDSDNDGVGDNSDAFPNDATEVADTDLDGIGNNADPDDDNDGVADADDGDPLNADIGIQPSQLISVSGNPVGVNGHSTRISLSYDTSDGNNQLPGIGFRIHYSSEMLSYAGTENSIANDIIVDGDGPYQDDSDFDNDLNTDKYIIFGWAALNGDWPNSSLPASLVDVVFNVSWEAFDQASITTPINFSKVSTTEGYNFEATNYTLNVLPATWDFDGNGQADALTDGLILLRHAFGVRGASLTDSVMATDSTMTSDEVQVAVEKALVIADVDGDGNVDALTDGLIVLRYMFGLTGDTLMDGVVSANATRASAESVQQHIELYMPNNLLPLVQSEQSFIVGDWKLASMPEHREYGEDGLTDWGNLPDWRGLNQSVFETCMADDIYRFGDYGAFEYLLNGSTFIDFELNPLGIYGDDLSNCISPFAPWNENEVYTYSIDENNSLLTLIGRGAFIALAHVANGTDDIENAAEAPESVSYDFTKLSETEVLLEIDAYDDFYRFTLEKVVN